MQSYVTVLASKEFLYLDLEWGKSYSPLQIQVEEFCNMQPEKMNDYLQKVKGLK